LLPRISLRVPSRLVILGFNLESMPWFPEKMATDVCQLMIQSESADTTYIHKHMTICYFECPCLKIYYFQIVGSNEIKMTVTCLWLKFVAITPLSSALIFIWDDLVQKFQTTPTVPHPQLTISFTAVTIHIHKLPLSCRVRPCLQHILFLNVPAWNELIPVKVLFETAPYCAAEKVSWKGQCSLFMCSTAPVR
jgi:hypothetical protein